MITIKQYSIIFAVAFILRLSLFVIIQYYSSATLSKEILRDDAGGYHTLAINFLERGLFSTKDSYPYTPDPKRTPVYPLFIALFYGPFGYNPFYVIFVQLMLGALNCLLAVAIARYLFSKTTALVTGYLLAFDYYGIIYSNLFLSDTLFLTLFLLHVFVLLRFIQTKSIAYLSSSALLLGLATLCRPVSIYFFIPAIVIISLRSTALPAIRYNTIFITVYLLSLLPWGMRNHIIYDRLTISSFQQSVLEWNLSNTWRESFPSNEIKQTQDTIGKDKYTGFSSISDSLRGRKSNYIDAVMKDLRKYGSGTIRYFFTFGSSNIPRLLGLPHTQIASIQSSDSVIRKLSRKTTLEWIVILYTLSFMVVLYIGMVSAIVILFRERKYFEIAFFLLIVGYFVISSAPFTFTPRYRLPVIPFITMLGGYVYSGRKREFNTNIFIQ